MKPIIKETEQAIIVITKTQIIITDKASGKTRICKIGTSK